MGSLRISMAEKGQPMKGQCVVDPRQQDLQHTITKYFFECYAPKRWEKLCDFLDPEYVAHGPNGPTALADGSLLAALTAVTEGTECSVEAVSFHPILDEELAAAGFPEDAH